MTLAYLFFILAVIAAGTTMQMMHRGESYKKIWLGYGVSVVFCFVSMMGLFV